MSTEAHERGLKPAIGPHLCEAKLGKAKQTIAIFQSRRSADIAGKHEAVQRRPATGFQVGVGPHGPKIGGRVGERKMVAESL